MLRTLDADTSKFLIDPTSFANEEQKKILSQLLFSNESENNFMPNKIYTLTTDDNKKINIILTKRIIKRASSLDISDICFDVIDEKILGGGYFGKVYPILGTLKKINDELFFKNNKKYVAKTVFVKKNGISNDILKEYFFSNRVRELHMKWPMAFYHAVESKHQNVMVMQRLPGETLNKILDEDRKKITLTTDQRLELTIKILRAWQMQVQAHCLVHRDIKPENIMVNLIFPNPEVTFFDYGLSTDSIYNDNKPRGTPTYSAPELFDNKEMTHQSDIYSIGCVLGEIWRSKEHPVDEWEALNIPYMTQVKMAYEFAKNRPFEEIFSRINDLSNEHQIRIKYILMKMVSAIKNDRGSIVNIIAEFEDIYLERKLANLTEEDKLSIGAAYRASFLLCSTLNNLALKYNNSIDMEVILIQDAFKNILHSVPDEPVVITEFVNTLGIPVLQNKKSRQAVLDEIDTQISDFETSRRSLEILSSKIQSLVMTITKKQLHYTEEGLTKRSLLQKINAKINRLLTRTDCDLTLNNIVYLAYKFDKYLKRFNDEYSNLADQVSIIALQNRGDSDFSQTASSDYIKFSIFQASGHLDQLGDDELDSVFDRRLV